ncbi:N-acyl-phosphatidylethanolamine-hydrolyzing phospholipase D [Bienertia sinuspersici]
MRKLLEQCELPAIVFGDFNEILYSDEKDGGETRDDRQMANFRHVVDSLALRDLGFKGSPYTWSRGKSVDTLVRERLDRYLASQRWCALFPNVVVTNLPVNNSDHGPILLKEEVRQRGTRSKMRRFESLWLSNENCEKVVKEKWNEDECMEAPTRIAQTLEKLSQWASSTFGNIKKQLKETEKRLKYLQSCQPDARVLA